MRPPGRIFVIPGWLHRNDRFVSHRLLVLSPKTTPPMSSLSYDDISYAMESTRVLHEPDRRIDTFGSTNFEFSLVSELMDSVDVVRVREGRIEAERPRILKPEGYENPYKK